jgi:CDP-diacylglycerol--glycerol-3-phosphate 3-phosphatidyltransferase
VRHLPNALTISRIISVPVLFWLAAIGNATWFAVLLFYALLSDVLDGVIARRFGLQTALGGVLDSIADALLLLSVPLACFVLYPALRARDWLTVAIVFAAYLLPIAYGYVKFQRLTSYHTLAARLAGWVLAIAFFSMVVWQVTWPLRLAAVVVVISQLEEMAITRLLPRWRANIPSFFHARSLASAEGR